MTKPRTLTIIDTRSIGGAGAVIVQALKSGGPDLWQPRVAGFWRGPEGGSWQFREAIEALGVPFHVLHQKHGFDPAAIDDALRVIREHDIQLLESHSYKAHLVCMALRARTGLPWVGFVHGWTSENAKVELYNLIDKVSVRFADRILPVSESLKQRLKLGPIARRKAQVLANAASPVNTKQDFVDRRREFSLDAKDIVIGVVGRLSPEKGQDYFVEAMKSVNARALIVGDGQERPKLEAMIRDGGLADKVKLAGFQTDVSSFYAACDIVCLPSLSEGMPNAALEAMMFGKAVVATSAGGIPEVVLNEVTGLLVPSKDPAALAAALNRVVSDSALRAKLGEAGKKRVETEFDARERARRLAEIYKSLIKS